MLALSRANKQSLVFHSAEDKESPAVLFSADSDFSFDQRIPWSDNMIITAAHHGSESNRRCYDKYLEETKGGDAIWVRSDGRFQKRPGEWYLQISQNQRYCTLCRGRRGKDHVEFHSRF